MKIRSSQEFICKHHIFIISKQNNKPILSFSWDIFLQVIGWLIFSFGLIGTVTSSVALLSKRVPITPVSKLESPENTQRPSTEEGLSGAEPETPDAISTVEQDDQQNSNEFELYNRVQISPKSEPNNVPHEEEEEEDEGIDGR